MEELELNRKPYLLKNITIPRPFFIRKLTFVIRKRDWWDGEYSLGVWWRLYTGVGIKGRPKKILKYIYLGLSIGKLRLWVDITYLANTKKSPTLKVNDLEAYLNNEL